MTEKSPQNDTLEWWRNITSLVVSILATGVLANYWIRDDKSMLYAGANIAFVHCTVDLAFTRSPEIWFHHFIVISFRVFQWIYGVDLTKTHFLMVELVRSELSTFFLAMRHILKYVNHTPGLKTKLTLCLEPFNEIAFVASFIYIRIWLYWKNALLEPELYRLSNFNITIQQPFAIAWIYGTVFIFFTLNLYWFALILKTLFKKLIPRPHSIIHAIQSELILEYTFYLNIFIAFQNYQKYIQMIEPQQFWNGLVDMIGIFYLSKKSHECHYQCGEYLKYTKYDSRNPTELEHPNYTRFLDSVSSGDSQVVRTYIDDSFAIQMRCLLVIMSWTDFTQREQILLFGLSAVIHTTGFLRFFQYFLSNYMNRNTTIEFDDLGILLPHLLPIFFDNIIIIIHPNSMIWQKVGLYTIMVLFMCMKICKPFYHYSHVGTHVLLWLQTYILSCRY